MEEQREESDKSKLENWREQFRDPLYRKKFICTLFLLLVFVYLGLGAGISGPSFLDLMLITNTELDQASTLFTSGAVGYMLGAFCSGIMYDKCNKLFLLACVTIGSSVSTGVKPLCTSLPVMIVVTVLGAFFAGGIDTGGNADLIRLWGREGRSFMQTLHFCFALGGLIAPLIVEPFLAPKSHRLLSVIMNNTNLTTLNHSHIDNSSTSSNISHESESRILIAYLIVGIYGIITSVPFIVEFFLRRDERDRNQKEDIPQESSNIPLIVYVMTVALIGTFFFTYCALEETFISYLTVFTVEGMKWTKADGALVTSVFWGSFAGCRFLGIFFIHFIAPKNMLILCLILLTISLSVFLVCSILTVSIGLWISSVGVGFATSIIFPTAFTWIEEHVIKVTGRVTSVIMISASSAGIATPVLLGYLMQNVTYMAFSYLLGVQSVVLLFLYIIMNIYSDKVLDRYRSPRRRNSSKVDTGEIQETSNML